MIKKFIDKLLGKSAAKSSKGDKAGRFGKRVEYRYEQHRIDQRLLDDNAIDVVETLKQAGHEAYIVGGAVRDLLTGLKPKDFDVATNATPEQVKKLFRRAFIIGRRFRIVHVVYGREVIEVSTFRAYLDSANAEQVRGDERSREQLAGKSHAVDEQGRVLRDNVWGPQHEDAARRDFTINALYYDPTTEIVVDYHGGVEDIKRKTIRMIGSPLARYREDPVRILRAARFAAKTGFTLEPHTRLPMRECAPLLKNIPAARLFDEMIKLLQTGHALESLKALRAEGLDRGLLPLLDVILDQPLGQKFVTIALQDTDRRVAEGKGVSPSFLFACLLWHEVLQRWNRLKSQGEHSIPALHQAADEALAQQAEQLAIQRRITGDMREIWLLQPRFERRVGKAPFTVLASPRFRAALDFFCLRADAGEADAALRDWWLAFSTAGEDERAQLMQDAQASGKAEGSPKKRRRRRKPKAADGNAPASAGLSSYEDTQ
jgi:poly(A) polymerase